MSDDSTWMPPGSGDTPPQPPLTPDASPTVPPSPAPMSPPPPDAPPWPSDAATAQAAQPAKRHKGVLIAAVVGVLAIGAAGTFAVIQMTGGSSGGAETPEAAGEAMMTAMSNEDALGMVDLLLPGERETFREPLVDLVSELARLELLAESTSLSEIEGFDVVLEDPLVDVDPTNVDDIVNITMSADATVSVDGDELPVGDLFSDLLGDDAEGIVDFNETESGLEFVLPMTAVEKDGRWYLSLFYTLAENGRQAVGEDIPEEPIALNGGDSPEGAVDALLGGVEALDLAKIVGSLNPNEAEALQRYAPLFLGDAQDAIDDAPLNWEVTDTAYTVTGSGSRRSVAINKITISGEFDGEPFSVSLDGGCVTAEADGESVDSCELIEDAGLDQYLDEAEAVEDFISEVQAAFDDYQFPGITVQQVDGAWYVSPIGTGFDQTLAVLRALDREEIDSLIDSGGTAFDDAMQSGPGGVLEGLPLVPEDAFIGEEDEGSTTETTIPFDTIPFDTIPFDTIPFDTIPEEDEGELDTSALIADCEGLGDVNEVAACLQALIDDGTVDIYSVRAVLLYPECGASEITLGTVSYYDLTDAEYTAIVVPAGECFNELIDSGEVDEFSIDPEFTRPECAEGRNPWLFEAPDADEFFSTWLDCIYA